LRELEEGACHELDEAVSIHEELLELIPAIKLLELAGTAPTEEDCSKSEELDSSTGVALLPSSPQATRPIATESSTAGNANRFILTS
jgi:hypothetical protein